MILRILFLGENWYGSCARACCAALRRLGHDVTDVDVQRFFPLVRRRGSRLTARLALPQLAGEYNDYIVDAARAFRPDVVVAFKAPQVRVETLRAVRALGAALYNYYPDTSVFAHGPLLPRALPEYDCVFYTKRFFPQDTASLGLRRTVFLPHGYDADIHRPLPLTRADLEQYGHDVLVAATYTRHKEEWLDGLVQTLPGLDLRIWGNQWAKRCRAPRLQGRLEGRAVEGTAYARAIRAARINLALLSGPVAGASQGDETTTRTFEIPACGGFMLHERSRELAELFAEGEEVACFGSVAELAAKIEHYLAHDDERRAIADAGHARCVPAYGYDARMAELVEWHLAEHGAARSAS